MYLAVPSLFQSGRSRQLISMYWRAAASFCCDRVVEGDSKTKYGRTASRLLSPEAQHNCRQMQQHQQQPTELSALSSLSPHTYMDIARWFFARQVEPHGSGRIHCIPCGMISLIGMCWPRFTPAAGWGLCGGGGGDDRGGVIGGAAAAAAAAAAAHATVRIWQTESYRV